MKLLLDTHVLLWLFSGDERLSEQSQTALLDPRHSLHLSVASWWEIAIKVGLHKLKLQSGWPVALKKEMRHNGIEWLPVRPEHCERIPLLPLHHRDPFDRLLVAQAQSDGLALVSADPHFVPYDVQVVW